jgi:anti-sigma B factor antagonist
LAPKGDARSRSREAILNTIIGVQQRTAATVISIDGDLDKVSIVEFDQLIDRPTGVVSYSVVLDLTGCTYCDSSALSSFVRAHQRLNGRLVIALPAENAPLQRLFNHVGLCETVSVFSSVEMAVTAVSNK